MEENFVLSSVGVLCVAYLNPTRRSFLLEITFSPQKLHRNTLRVAQ